MKQADLFNVKGHVALVTGAASGLGLAFAEVMAENGARVVLTDIDPAALGRAASRLAAAGCTVEQAVVDIAETETLRAVIDKTAQHHGRLDAVFANAGISSGPGFALSPSGAIDEMDLALFERALEINLKSTFLTIRFAAAQMKRQRGGSIIATTSIAGMRSEPLVGYGYTAAKAAVANIVRHAAVELAPYNVRVNAIAPGPIATPMTVGVPDENFGALEAMVPMGRLGRPEEVAAMMCFLVSDLASYCTGQVYVVDGGYTAK